MKKTTKKPAVKPAQDTALALVRRELTKLQKQLQPRVEVLPAAAPPALARVVEQQPMALSEVTNLGHLGLQPLELSEKAEAILARDVDEARVLIKPTGAVYYPHIEYTRWFNEAFGRARWSVVPASKPQMSEIPKRKGDDDDDEKVRFLVTQDFVLFVHGKPVAQAKAGAEYHPGNREQMHDDVLEALNASALRRLAKRLGVGDVLWDRRWTNSFLERHGVKVWVRGQNKPQWRHRDDRPLPGETGIVQDRGEQPQQKREPRSTQQPRGEELITQGSKEKPGQVERLWSIAGRAGRTRQELHDWLLAAYGIDSLKKIKRKDYEDIVRAVQSSKPLPLPEVHQAPDPTDAVVSADDIPWGDRVPGEEG